MEKNVKKETNMKKKKIITIIGVVVFLIIITTCIVIQVVIAEKNKELEKESKKYETLITKTKEGSLIETEYTHVDNHDFYIKVPKSFKQLTKEEIMKKYNGEVPSIVFSNDDLTINVAISMTNNKMLNTEIKQYKEYMETLLKNSGEIIESKYFQVDGHNIGQIKLISKAVDTEIYNNMIFFSYQDKLVIITFNCTKKWKEEWQQVGDFIIDSLFFSE